MSAKRKRQEPAEELERQKFLELLEPHMTQDELEHIDAAYTLAESGHRGQERDGGGPYFDHPKEVARSIILELGIQNDYRLVVTALLHDVLEDSRLLSEDRIRKNFGKAVALWVRLLSKIPKEGYHKRLEACGIWQVLLVKLCDRLHNLRSIPDSGWSEARRKKYHAETEELYLPLADKLFRLIPKRYLGCVAHLRTQIGVFVGVGKESEKNGANPKGNE